MKLDLDRIKDMGLVSTPDWGRMDGWVFLLIAGVFFCCLCLWIRAYEKKNTENIFLKRQNEYLRISYEASKRQYLALKRMRHDLANLYVLEAGYLESGQYECLREHYRAQIKKIKNTGKLVCTGNMGIDAVVNYKLWLAEQLQIAVEKRVVVSGNTRLTDRELTILIGNLLDNAMEAVLALETVCRKVGLIIEAGETVFFLKVSNPFWGRIQRDGDGSFLTGKREKDNHGLGLAEVEDIVRKYGGDFLPETMGNEFVVRILIYKNKN